MMQTLLQTPEGPLVQYDPRTLTFAVNESLKSEWRVGPLELIMMGWCCWWAGWMCICDLHFRKELPQWHQQDSQSVH